MAFDLVVQPEAEHDLIEAFRWYESQRRGLGHEFLLQVGAGFGHLGQYPLACPELYRGVRRHIIRRFPYKVFYKVEQKTVIILAVVYGGRDLQWVKKRLEEF